VGIFGGHEKSGRLFSMLNLMRKWNSLKAREGNDWINLAFKNVGKARLVVRFHALLAKPLAVIMPIGR
jgi:hypothetical protein